jgi:hypothetical protein
MIGKILDAVREAQAAGEIDTREEALACARDYLMNGSQENIPPEKEQ